MKRPAAVFGFSALFTIITAILFSEAVVYAVFAAAGVLCAVFGFMRRKKDFTLILTILTAVCLSFLSYKASYELKYLPASQFDKITCTLTGTAAYFPQTSGSYTVLKLENCTANGTELDGGAVFYGKEMPDIRPGDTVTVKNATLTCADKNSAFFFHSLSKNEYFSVFGGSLSSTAGARKGIIFKILSLRRLVSNRLRISLSSEAFPIADALITGNQDSVSAVFSNRLRVAGASHIFAVSGMHLSVWTLVLFFAFKFMFGTRRIMSIPVIAFVLFFIVFSGKSPSVIRAGIMLITVFIGKLLKRPADALNSLGLASALCVTVNPFLAGNVSFLLSTAATAGVVVSSQLVNPKKIPVNFFALKKLAVSIVCTLVASVTVTVFTMPISAYFFGSSSLLSGISSLLCTLPAEGTMVFGALGAAFIGTEQLGGFLFYVCEKLCGFISVTIQKLAEFECFLITVDAKSIAVLYTAMFAAAYAASKLTSKKKTAAVAVTSLFLSAALTAVLISHAFSAPQTLIYIAGGKNGDILISENHGASTVVLGMSGSYSSTSEIKSMMTNDGRVSTDLLILSNGLSNKQKLISAYFPAEILYADGSSTLCPSDSTVKNAEFTLSPSTTLKYTNNGGFRGCILRTADKTVVFIFSGKSFALPDEYLNADIAVFKYGLPDNASKLHAQKIMLSTYADGDGTVMSANTKGIKITASEDIKWHR